MLRKARLQDTKAIRDLINFYGRQDLMLPRSLNEIYENLRDFWLWERGRKIIGCVALHVVGWESLAEIKSLAVKEEYHSQGIGTRLVRACLKESQTLGVKKVFVLTYQQSFFRQFGFRVIDRAKLPQKIWVECRQCHKFPDCDETALWKRIK